MVCILAKGSGDCASPAYHDHPPQRLLQNFPDTTLASQLPLKRSYFGVAPDGLIPIREWPRLAPSCRKPANPVGREIPPFRTLQEFKARAARVEIAVAGLFRRRHVSTPGAAIHLNCASACSASPYPRIISCRLALRLERGSRRAPRRLPPARCPDWCNRAGGAWR